MSKFEEETAELLDKNISYSTEEVGEMLTRNEKGKVNQSIDNCMLVLQNDPILSGAICHNDLTDKMEITKNLGWDMPKNSGIRDVDINQIEWYMERTYGLKKFQDNW